MDVCQKCCTLNMNLLCPNRSTGATVVEMLKGEPPWYEYEPTAAMFKIVTDITEPNLPSHCSEHALGFVSLCFIK